MALPSILVAACSLAISASVVLGAPPKVFTDKPYEEAKRTAVEQKRIFIVKGTADWCPPCKMMDRQTWPDERVARFIAEHAVAYSLDVDKEPELARELGIRAMPTIVAFRDGEPFDRAVGFQSPEQMLAFMESVKRGESASAARMADLRVRAERGSGRELVEARMELARELASAGDHEKAAETYVWLWENMLEHHPSMVGVRASFMASEMEGLAGSSEAARAKFAELRDRAEERLKGEGGDYETLRDWLTLNEVTGETERTLAWVDRVKGDEEGVATIRRAGARVERLLMQHGRWETYGRIVRDPERRVRQSISQHEMTMRMIDTQTGQMPEGIDIEAMKASMRRGVHSEIAGLYAGLLSASRHAEAAEVREAALAAMDSPELRERMVETALGAGAAHPDLRELCGKEEGGLRERVDRELARREMN